MMNFGSESVRRMDMSKMARVLTGNGVKEELLSPSYTSFPELAISDTIKSEDKTLMWIGLSSQRLCDRLLLWKLLRRRS